MGQLRDIVNAADNTKGVADEVRETLGILRSLAEAKGEAYKEKIESDLKSGKTGDDLTVSITKIIDKRTQYRAVTKTGTTKIVDEVKKSLVSLFSGDGRILDGISGIVNSAFTAIMGAGEGQEVEVTYYSVVAEYPAIIRFDFAFWGRNIHAQSIKNYMENVFTCVAYKSAVDVTKLAFNDFLALYGPILKAAYGADESKLKEMVQQAREIYSLFKVPIKELQYDVDVKALVHEASSKPLLKIVT